VFGSLACLAGGAQLHSRANLIEIGGRIDTSSLAEDTFTTFKTQLNGRRVVFEPHATVLAEEPEGIEGLWKQRLRWARGNVQVTKQFRHLWFRPSRSHGLGAVSFGIFWFCLFLLPIFMITASVGLAGLYFMDFPLSWRLFHLLWITNAITYAFITSFSLMIDPTTGRHVWRQAVMFPGAINLVIIVYTCLPVLFTRYVAAGLTDIQLRPTPLGIHCLVLADYVWLGASMAVAWLAKWAEPHRFGRWLSPLLVYVVGYGPLLCAVTFTSYVKELRRAEMTWDKTEKTGRMMAA
jgi:cellulose synthase/poly-beta-1,6-N-acetylglucosamine synthase-like glycosyltransferase